MFLSWSAAANSYKVPELSRKSMYQLIAKHG